LPIRYYSVLNGVLQGKDTTLGLSFVADVTVLLSHANHDSLMARSSDDGWENSSWSIISSKSSFAHTGSIVNDQGSNFFVTHFASFGLCLRKAKATARPTCAHEAAHPPQVHRLGSGACGGSQCIDDIIIDGDGEADMCTRSRSSATSASSRLRREPYKPYDEEVVVVVVVGEADGDGEGDGEGTKIGCKTVRS